MADDWESLIDELEGTEPEVRSTKGDRPTFPCYECGGTGKYQGARVHQEKSHCFACRGKGYFLKSPEKRAASAQRRANRKEAAKEVKNSAVREFSKEHPAMYAELEGIHLGLTTKTEFLHSLANQLFRKGFLSQGQITAWYRGKEKLEAIKRERAEEAAKNRTSVDLQAIRDMFTRVHSTGYKKPKYRADGLILSLANSSGRNPGAIYVKDEEGNYLGKIVGTSFSPTREAPKNTGEILIGISSDPFEAALRYGQRTGKCACCGRELTNGLSIELGIGPVCRDRWGI